MNSLPPPGWHPDHQDPTKFRYWDGRAWTDQVSSSPGVSAAPEGVMVGNIALVGAGKNEAPTAYWARWMMIATVLTCVAFPFSIWFGIKTLDEVKANPSLRGSTTGWLAIVVGSLPIFLIAALFLL